jgi:Rhamnan synthesis protein F
MSYELPGASPFNAYNLGRIMTVQPPTASDFSASLTLRRLRALREDRARITGREPSRNYVPPAAVTDAKIFCLKTPTLSDEVALFVTHSPHGHLKPHVRHYLDSLNRHGITTILVVAADAPFSDATADLLRATSGVFVRQNDGYDFAAWAHILRLQPELFNTTILYFMNDSILGPTNDGLFGELLTRIRDSSADFIGLTDSYQFCWHIQSYFMAFKERALSSGALRQFINNIVSYVNKTRVIKEYETQLASILTDSGLNCETMFPSPTGTIARTLFQWRALLESGFPFIKVAVICGRYPEVDVDGWRNIVASQGYDVSVAESMIMDALTSSTVNSPAPAVTRERVSSTSVMSYAVRFMRYGPNTGARRAIRRFWSRKVHREISIRRCLRRWLLVRWSAILRRRRRNIWVSFAATWKLLLQGK